MQLTHLTEGDTVLTYSLQTDPTPIQVSLTSGPPKRAALTFVISAPRNLPSVAVTQIVFKLPIGNPAAPDANDLTETAQGILPSVSSSSGEAWSFAPGAAPGIFVLKPAGTMPPPITSQGLTVTLGGIQVSPIVGTAQVQIIEFTASDDPQPRHASIAVPKFPPGFSAGNFCAEEPMVANGAPAILRWNGDAGANYVMLWGVHSRDVTGVRRWVSPALTDTTTFILNVSLQQGGQTLVLSFSVTVIVANPSLVARDLTVLTTTHLAGPVTGSAKSTLAALDVTGTATVASLVSHALKAEGATTIADLVVGAHLVANGQVSLISLGEGLTPGRYMPHTDGFMLGYIVGMGPKRSWGMIRCTAGGGASGGNLVSWMNGSEPVINSLGNGFLVPIKQGIAFDLLLTLAPGNDADPWTSFAWVPLGSALPGQPTLQKIG